MAVNKVSGGQAQAIMKNRTREVEQGAPTRKKKRTGEEPIVTKPPPDIRPSQPKPKVNVKA